MRNSKSFGSSLPQVFNYTTNPIRVQEINNQIYFVANDLCCALGLSNSRRAVSHLDGDERLLYTMRTSGQGRDTWLVTESGLYHLIFQSRKKEAKAFRRWVTGEVLPSLRSRGSYEVLPAVQGVKMVNGVRMFPFAMMARALGYVSGGSLYDRRRRFPNHFAKLDELWFVTESMSRQMAATRRLYTLRAENRAALPVVGVPEELPSLFDGRCGGAAL